MPYQGEKASKLGHTPIILNPDIKESIETYKVGFNPNDGIKDILSNMTNINTEKNNLYHIFSVDGSYVDVPVDDRYPSARIGFIQFSMNLIRLYENSEVEKNGMINPVEYNKLMEAHTQSLDLPIYNTTVGNYNTLRDSIRFKISEHLEKLKTYDEKGVSVLDTLYEIISEKEFKKNFKCINLSCETNNQDKDRVEFSKNDFNNKHKESICKCCGEKLYLIDYLRLHEIVEEEFGATGVLSRVCRVLEQLYPINFIMNLLTSCEAENVKFEALSKIGFMLDGPLAIYGEPAKLHKSIHRYLIGVNRELISRGFNPLIYFGITKTGSIVDHVKSTIDHIKYKTSKAEEDLLPKRKLLIISDSYRFKYIHPPTQNPPFGKETYYGQDIVYFDSKSNFYVINVMYPLEKNDINFKVNKFNIDSYDQIDKIANLLETLEVDLYDIALLPIVLGHKYASISYNPGASSLAEFGKNIIK
ncbi:TPA: hypothetical protein ACKOG4_002207 [Clostridioides difficile]